MRLNNIRLLVKDFDNIFKFYSEKVGLNVTWGKLGSDYASFEIGIDSNKIGLSIFKTDLMANAIDNADKQLPVNCREKFVIVIQVDNVDNVFSRLKKNGIKFIDKPSDIADWGSRVAHFRDPEDNSLY